MNIKSLFINCIITLILFGSIWFAIAILGLISLFCVMFVLRNNPAYDLEMGWMVFILLVPVVAMFVSIPCTIWGYKKIKNKGYIKTGENSED